MTDEEMAAFVETLGRLREALGTTRWWVIGSAAVVLHGGPTCVADVDVLLDPADAPAVFAKMGLPLRPGRADDRFRSDLFARWTAPPMPVELMAGLHLRDHDGWTPVALATRVLIGGTPVPDRAELAALLRRFGRPKDLARAALLGDQPTP